MKLYEFTLEVQDGENEYLLHQFVAASTDRLAARFVQRTAQNFRPNAKYDAKSNLFEAREGYPIWRIGSVREVTEIIAPCADGGDVVVFNVQPTRSSRSGKHPAITLVA
jgi:hypothetical protein